MGQSTGNWPTVPMSCFCTCKDVLINSNRNIAHICNLSPVWCVELCWIKSQTFEPRRIISECQIYDYDLCDRREIERSRAWLKDLIQVHNILIPSPPHHKQKKESNAFLFSLLMCVSACADVNNQLKQSETANSFRPFTE